MRLFAHVSDASLDQLQATVAMALLGLSLVCLPRAYQRVWQVWQPATARTTRVATVALALAAIVRWLVAPKWIVTIYIGYHLTQQAIDLFPVSHYGVGSSALYHALFGVLPHDHRTLLWVNSVLGVLTIPFLATFARRYHDDPRAGVAAAALVALTPLFIKNDNSDANHVPCLWWLYGALVLWDEYIETRERAPLLQAGALFTLACIARPEMPVLLPIVLGLLTVGYWPKRDLWRDPWLYATLALMAAALLPQVEHVTRQVDALQMRSSLPAFGANRTNVIAERFVRMNTLLTPSLFPPLILAFAALGLLMPRPLALRRWALALAAVPSIAIYSLDLCRANMARVHVPGALLVTLLASAGVAYAWERVRIAPLRLALVVVTGFALSRTIPPLWAPTNEQAEEDFLREALPRLPAGRLTLVRIGHGDREIIPGKSLFTHDHFPDYLVTPPVGEGQVMTIHQWTERPDFSAPVFFYGGMRCYAQMRQPADAAPRGENYQRACAEMRERFVLEPVIERTVPNRRDVWLEYYGDAPRFKLGLYRVRPRAQ